MVTLDVAIGKLRAERVKSFIWWICGWRETLTHIFLVSKETLTSWHCCLATTPSQIFFFLQFSWNISHFRNFFKENWKVQPSSHPVPACSGLDGRIPQTILSWSRRFQLSSHCNKHTYPSEFLLSVVNIRSYTLTLSYVFVKSCLSNQNQTINTSPRLDGDGWPDRRGKLWIFDPNLMSVVRAEVPERWERSSERRAGESPCLCFCFHCAENCSVNSLKISSWHEQRARIPKSEAGKWSSWGEGNLFWHGAVICQKVICLHLLTWLLSLHGMIPLFAR